jgi:hypothetical protein
MGYLVVKWSFMTVCCLCSITYAADGDKSVDRSKATTTFENTDAKAYFEDLVKKKIGTVTPSFPFGHILRIGEITTEPYTGAYVSETATKEVKNIDFTKPPSDGFPAVHIKNEIIYPNCTAVQQSTTYTREDQVKHGEEITTTRGVTTQNTVKVDISLKADIKFVSGGVTGSETWQKTIADTKAERITSESTERTNWSVPVLVPSMSIVTGDATLVQYDGTLPYSADVVVDGQLTDVVAKASGKKTLSDLFTEAERTFKLEGHVRIYRYGKISPTLIQTALTPDDCEKLRKAHLPLSPKAVADKATFNRAITDPFSKSSENQKVILKTKKNGQDILLAQNIPSEGEQCYVSSCEMPLNGMRTEICRYRKDSDDNLTCTSCGPESDPQCDPPPAPEEPPPPSDNSNLYGS